MRFRHLRNFRGFFSDYYIGSVFGRGTRRRKLADRATDLAFTRFRRIRERAEGRATTAAECRERFHRPLLRDVLGFHLGAGEDRIRPLFASAEDEEAGAPPLLLVWCGGFDEDLDVGAGNARASERLAQALARRGLRHGLLLSGGEIRLLRAPGEGPRGSWLGVDLAGLLDDEDLESFAALLAICGARSFVARDGLPAPIDEIERESREHAEKVTEDLRGAVFSAAEWLVGGLLEDAVARGAVADSADLSNDALSSFRDAALTAIYRILFVLYAEARDPRLDEHEIYRKSYSLEGLIAEILSGPLDSWPENRTGMWSRLRALFRIYDDGLPAITPWQPIPPRGGDFFDATTPHGRLLDEARLSDACVAKLLIELATTQPRPGVGRERVSFRELDIESLGSVYAGLLDHEPRIARETAIELRVQGRRLILEPRDVVRLCRQKSLTIAGDATLLDGTEARQIVRDRPPTGLGEGESAGDSESPFSDEADDRDGGTGDDGAESSVSDPSDGDGDEDAEIGVRKGAAVRLVRRLERGTFHFAPGPARKGSGSYYTPLALVDDVVRHALGPLVAERTAAEIEALRVLDPACGSAHFLVEAMRFLGQALHRAYVAENGRTPPPEFRSTVGQGWDDACDAPDAEARAAASEARAWCKRRIAERCLFGVDLNPTAVELARVALWIESLAGDRPLTYFEHHVRVGNSLLGTWLDRLEMPPLPDLGARASSQGDLFAHPVRRALEEAARVRLLIDAADPEALRREGVEPESAAEIEFKEAQRRRADAILEAARLLFGLRSAAAFVPEIWAHWPNLLGLAGDAAQLRSFAQRRPWWDAFAEVCARERFFHWQLEFPEVLLRAERSGFDAVLGNPPWDKVLPARHEFYAAHDVLIRAFKGNELDARIAELEAARPGLRAAFAAYRERTTTIAKCLRRGGDFPHSEARTQAAHEDVSKYFLDRAARLCAGGGAVGMIVPSVVYNGDGCVGLRRMLLEEAAVERFYAFENRKQIFPIHRSYKFVSLVFRRGAAAGGFNAAFMRHELAELADDAPKPWTVRMERDEILRLSPDTLAFLELRGPRDLEIVRRMHAGRPTLGGDGPGAWSVELVSWRAHEVIYNSAEDKDLFTDSRSGELWIPSAVLGSEPADFDETLARMRERGFWPVFEGKHIDQWVVGTKPVRWWLSVEQAERKYGKPPRREPTLVFRETARNTDERTCIAAVLPAGSAASHTLSAAITDIEPNAVAALLNSLCFDWSLRFRTAGTHVSFTYLRPTPVPPMNAVASLPQVPTALAWQPRGASENQSDLAAAWRVDRAVAEVYGLGADDLAHILESFPVLARKRPALVAFFAEEIDAWRNE